MTIKSITDKTNKLLEQNKKDIAAAEAELAKSQEDINRAEAKLLKAQKEIDAAAYTAAKSELWTAERTKEFYEQQLHELKDLPLLDYAEYRQTVSEVFQEADAEQADLINKAAESLEELKKLAEQATEKQSQVNSLLSTLEKEISRGNEEFKKTEQGAYDSRYFLGLSYQPANSLPQVVEAFNDIMNRITK